MTESKKLELDSRNANPAAASDDPWEIAYLRFETPEQEIEKFVKRLEKAGVREWPRESEVVELFCGRGSGLHALRKVGFSHVEGVDLSPRLLAQYSGDDRCIVGDCRELPFANESKDALIVQGGLHHLPKLPEDLEKTVAEMHRVLKKDGRVLLVEPWLTPFLRTAHGLCESSLARRLSSKVDALATMIEYERVTYEKWLNNPDIILKVVHAGFVPISESFNWGKWSFVGRPV